MTYPLVHIEFPTQDTKKSLKWYADVLGWETSFDEKMNYGMLRTGADQVGGGINPLDAAHFSAGAIPYVSSDDIPALLKKVTASGGTVLMEETPIPTMGTLAMFTDPDGNRIGVINFPAQGA
ncbi:MAG: VOC family protein [Anaerolineaceae bacterium]|nr:VOC family protein [Anaerolineaceae bacterium]